MTLRLEPPVSDHAALIESGLFDDAFYRTQAALTPQADVVRHYLELGWTWGLRPKPDFESEFLLPFYAAAGLDGAPLLHWIELSAGRAALPSSRAEAESYACQLRHSPAFDADAYARRLPEDMDPALHYVIVGEALGWRPSSLFDPVYYNERYPDIAQQGLPPLLHFEVAGRSEGRRIRPVAETLAYPPLPATTRPVVLMIIHDGSRTGAPLLGLNLIERMRSRYEVVCVLLRGGSIEADLLAVASAMVAGLTWEDWHPAEMSRLGERLVQAYGPRFAIANSIESNLLVPPLAMRGVPSVALVHEFATYTRPIEKMSNIFDWATDIVFPARIVAESTFRAFEHMRHRRGVHVLAQGRVDVPAPADKDEGEDLAAAVRPAGTRDRFIVLGAGAVQMRKGTDLFFSAAAAARRLAPDLDIHFIWIGDGYDPKRDTNYSVYLEGQYQADHLESLVTILPPVPDLNQAYASSDVFLLSSRLDPQPNVGIDAMVRGLPVVCFEGASGTAEVLDSDPETRCLIAPHLDAHGAAEIICELARDRHKLSALRAAVRRVGEATYDMPNYVERLVEFGEHAAARLHQADRQLLLTSDVLDPDLILPPFATAPGVEGLVNTVLQQWAAVGTSPNQAANQFFRRPCAGFHPQRYAVEHEEACTRDGANPLAHWLRAGRPPGPWSREVLQPLQPARRIPLRVAVHAHFHYEALAPDLAQRLTANATPCDLFVTTDTEAKAARLRSAFARHPGEVVVTVVPNRGRDVGPFLHVFPQMLGYDAIAHVHGKRSAAIDADMGDRWREFLWENLIGAIHPMLDTAADAFASDPAAALLIAEDPHLVGWDQNRDIADALARRMGLPAPDEEFFDFPLGTMFWARPGALGPLLKLGLDWDDYPSEPIPKDGTILHALERLLPFIIRAKGGKMLGLRVPGTTW